LLLEFNYFIWYKNYKKSSNKTRKENYNVFTFNYIIQYVKENLTQFERGLMSSKIHNKLCPNQSPLMITKLIKEEKIKEKHKTWILGVEPWEFDSIWERIDEPKKSTTNYVQIKALS